MQEKISIIVPIYNCENYLDKCIESIICQTYKNLEIILIDDGSIDNCPKMVDSYCKKDSRIKAIHQKNKGLSGARNTGLEVATGEYIAFVDADDWIEPNMYEVLYKALIENDADMSVCNMFWDDFSGLVNDYSLEIGQSYHFLSTAYKNRYGENLSFSFIVVWNKLYKRDVFSSLRFSSKWRWGEDMAVLADIVGSINKGVFVHSALYHYRSNANSLIRKPWCDERMSSVYTYDLFLNSIKGKISQDVYNRWSEQFLSLSVRMIKMVLDTNYTDKKHFEEIVELVGRHIVNKKKNFCKIINYIKYNCLLVCGKKYFKIMSKLRMSYEIYVDAEKS